MSDSGKATLWGTLIVSAVVALSGCSTPRAGRTWYSPATWFSGTEAVVVARTETKLGAANAVLLGSAQRTAHETQIALAVAPTSRPVAIARESNDTTVASLDQLAGPLTVAQVALLRAQVSGLLSEVQAERARAEGERQSRRSETMEASTTISELKADLTAAQAKLKVGFERENAVANSYRNLKFWIYGAIAIWVFVAFILPVIGSAFPAVGAVASIGQGIFAPFAVAAARRTKRLAGDLVCGIHEMRQQMKTRAITKDEADTILKSWVTEADGTAAKVDMIRREKGLL